MTRVTSEHEYRTMSMRDAMLADRAQEEAHQFIVSPLCDDQESGAMRCRLQHLGRIALDNLPVDDELRVIGALLPHETVEHLLGTHVRIEIGRERA